MATRQQRRADKARSRSPAINQTSWAETTLEAARQRIMKGDAVGAHMLCDEVLKAEPENVLGLHILGMARFKLNDYAGAHEALDRALEIDPDNVPCRSDYGMLLLAQNRLEETIETCDRVIAMDPNYANAHNTRGVALKHLKRYDESEKAHRCAIELQPNYPEAYSNLAVAVLALGREEEAVSALRKSIALDPTFKEAYSNLGKSLRQLCRYEEAEAAYTIGLRNHPGHPEITFNLSLTLLGMGRFKEGWEGYESRWQMASIKGQNRKPPGPQWLGQDLAGKRIFLWAEQGFGDTFQFIRYASLLKERGATVVAEVPELVIDLIRHVNGVDEVLTMDDPFPTFDYHLPLMSLPKVMETTIETIPAPVPYIFAPVEQQSLPEIQGAKLKVGLVWAGTPDHIDDYNRSCPIKNLIPLFADEEIAFYSLQKGVGEDDFRGLIPKHANLADLAPGLENFSDTAAAIAQLDVVISVDTAAAHLAGAMGKPTWLILPYSAEYRWLTGREDSPWYPTMRLFRPDGLRDWGSIMRNLQSALADLKTQT